MATAAARGRLEGDGVVVADPLATQRLHGRSHFGALIGDRLRLQLVEAAWLASEGKLEVEGRGRLLGAADLLATDGTARLEVAFLAYADLRSRGLVVRAVPGGWGVWPRGRAEGEPEYVVEVHSERDAPAARDVVSWARSERVLALVDEDGAVTYYRAAAEEPAGSCPVGNLATMGGILLSDRVLVTEAAAIRAAAKEHVGVRTAAGLVLSFTEAEALRRRGVLDIPATLAARAAATQPHFRLTLPVYEALRAAGVVAKSGFKFGTHLRGYRSDPEAGHAEWLILCVAPADPLPWPDLSRAIRLAHGVRKKFLVAVVDGTGVRFTRLAWFKP